MLVPSGRSRRGKEIIPAIDLRGIHLIGVIVVFTRVVRGILYGPWLRIFDDAQPLRSRLLWRDLLFDRLVTGLR